jgi:fructose-bisphosphate aldolase, class I
MYEEIRELILEAKEHGLPTVMWAYPRGAGLAKEGEQAVDITAYAAQVACQLGAHIVKVKPPKDVVYQDEAKKVFEKFAIPTKTLSDRIRHVVQSCFAGKRIVIFSGGEAKDDASVMEEVKQIATGGAFGSIMGRNAFQRPREGALKLLGDVMNVFKNA